MLDAFLAATEDFLLIVGVAWMFWRFIHAFPPAHAIFTLLYLGFAGYALFDGRPLFTIVFTVLWLLWIAPGVNRLGVKPRGLSVDSRSTRVRR